MLHKSGIVFDSAETEDRVFDQKRAIIKLLFLSRLLYNEIGIENVKNFVRSSGFKISNIQSVTDKFKPAVIFSGRYYCSARYGYYNDRFKE